MSDVKKPTKAMQRLLWDVLAIDQEIAELYEKKEKIVKKLFAKYGTGRFQLLDPADEEKDYRFYLKDHEEAFLAGEPIFKSTAISRFEISHRVVNKLK